MRTLRQPVFIICLVLFILNRALEWKEVFLWPLYAYLDDLLAMPIVLAVVLTAERLYFKDNKFTLPRRYIVWAVVLFGLFFELLLPALATRYTADAVDVLAYAIGGAVFHVWLNKPILSGRETIAAAQYENSSSLSGRSIIAESQKK